MGKGQDRYPDTRPDSRIRTHITTTGQNRRFTYYEQLNNILYYLKPKLNPTHKRPFNTLKCRYQSNKKYLSKKSKIKYVLCFLVIFFMVVFFLVFSCPEELQKSSCLSVRRFVDPSIGDVCEKITFRVSKGNENLQSYLPMRLQ